MTAPGSTILAIDLREVNRVRWWYAPVARGADFRTAATTPEALRREFARRPVARVVVEAGVQAGWVQDRFADVGLGAVVASTTGSAWRWKWVKLKTDRDDALKLARVAAIGELDPVAVPPRAVRQWKSLIGLRELSSAGWRCKGTSCRVGSLSGVGGIY